MIEIFQKFNKKYPPIWGELNIEEWKELVDEKSFPECSNCGQRIYHPDFYDDPDLDMCGPCTTGESATLMWHIEEADFRYEYFSKDYFKELLKCHPGYARRYKKFKK